MTLLSVMPTTEHRGTVHTREQNRKGTFPCYQNQGWASCSYIGPFHVLSFGQQGIIWENSSWHRSKPDEGQSCGMHIGCRPFSSHRPGLFAWMDIYCQGSILTARQEVSLRNKAFKVL